MAWVECIGSEVEKGRLSPYVANIAVNLWDYDLLQQCNTQVTLLAVSKTHVFVNDIINKGHQPSPTLHISSFSL